MYEWYYMLVMNIPFVDLSRQPKKLHTTIHEKLKNVIGKGNFILGHEVGEFEDAFAKYLGVKHCVGLASGTDAILLSLMALGLKEGDEVIVPAMTFIASVAPLIHLRIKPVFVDIASDIVNIDVTRIEKAITKKTKAIIPVHLHGFPADMNAIMDIAHRYKLFVIEDAAQAHGALIKCKMLNAKCKIETQKYTSKKRDEENNWKKVGTIGDIGCFSFYPSKNLGAWGDAGALVTKSDEIAGRVRLLRDHGQEAKYVHSILGYNSRLDTIQAVVLSAKLSYLDFWNKKRRQTAQLYSQRLRDLPVVLPAELVGTRAIYHVYQIRTKLRDQLHAYLIKQGIHTSFHYPIPLHLQPALKFLGYKKGSFPVSERFADETLSLPMFPYLSHREVRFVANYIHRFSDD